LLGHLLGAAGSRPLSEPPRWPSNIADDNTPVEFSVAFNRNERPSLRMLAEALAPNPSPADNRSAALRFLDFADRHFGLSMSMLDRIRDVFLPENPDGEFSLWHSIVFRGRHRPEFKVYLNPEIRGAAQAPDLVAEAMTRLGLVGSYRAILDRGVRPGEVGHRDRFTFFALDLHDGPHARVKLYVSHHDAQVRDVVRAAGLVDGVDPAELAGFCELTGGGNGPFTGRPLLSSYTFVAGVDRPVGYSLYVPIRSYVRDDGEARHRVSALLDRCGFDGTDLDRSIAAVTGRRLDAGLGLIAHTSLRLGRPRPGVTVYLSSEAYRVTPPRRPSGPAPCAAAPRPAGPRRDPAPLAAAKE
jgi:DMATS type aromatic prenyltransferase